jgi:hypothetical protein
LRGCQRGKDGCDSGSTAEVQKLTSGERHRVLL